MNVVDKLELRCGNYSVSVPVDGSQIPRVSDEVQALFTRIHFAPPNLHTDKSIVKKMQIRTITQQIAIHQTSCRKRFLPTLHLVISVLLTTAIIFCLSTPFIFVEVPLIVGILLAFGVYGLQVSLNSWLLDSCPDATLIGGISQECDIAEIRHMQEGLRAFQRDPLSDYDNDGCYILHLLLNPFFY